MSLTDKKRCRKSPPWKSWEVLRSGTILACVQYYSLYGVAPINKADRLRRLPRASNAKIADLNFGVS